MCHICSLAFELSDFNNCSLIDLSLRNYPIENLSNNNERWTQILQKAYVSYYKYLLVKCIKIKYWHEKMYLIKKTNNSFFIKKIKYKLIFLRFGHFVASVLVGFC